MLQFQHHQLLQTACPHSHTPAASSFPSSDGPGTCKASNSILLSELQRENSFELAFAGSSQLLQPHFFGVSVSPVSSAAHLLDTQLYISGGGGVPPLAASFSQQQSFSAPSPSYDGVTLQHGDCEMEDLTSSQLGKFVLVKWELRAALVAGNFHHWRRGDEWLSEAINFEVCEEAAWLRKLATL